MSESCPQYRVHYQRRGSDLEHDTPSGGHDYRWAALAERNNLFGRDKEVVRCWITKERIATGKVLQR